MPNAGFYRILGRLVEYDVERQIAKIESCFHHEYTPSEITPPLSAYAKVSTNTATVQKGRPSTGTHSTAVIDLTETDDQASDSEDVSAEGELSSSDDETNRYVDLTLASDGDESHKEEESEAEQMPLSKEALSDNIETREMCAENGTVTQKQELGPKVILWIDTRLLDRWSYEPRALFQFIGEVVYEAGHWMLQAQIYRNMEGLDLYTYRQSILLTRTLMQRGTS
ncbi:hypothetical protein BGX28_005512 [Mortierella sp. GBA30]|nr:hypothetical protein BGX28_005512 [Mortierella sp. GBA30]